MKRKWVCAKIHDDGQLGFLSEANESSSTPSLDKAKVYDSSYQTAGKKDGYKALEIIVDANGNRYIPY